MQKDLGRPHHEPIEWALLLGYDEGPLVLLNRDLSQALVPRNDLTVKA